MYSYLETFQLTFGFTPTSHIETNEEGEDVITETLFTEEIMERLLSTQAQLPMAHIWVTRTLTDNILDSLSRLYGDDPFIVPEMNQTERNEFFQNEPDQVDLRNEFYSVLALHTAEGTEFDSDILRITGQYDHRDVWFLAIRLAYVRELQGSGELINNWFNKVSRSPVEEGLYHEAIECYVILNQNETDKDDGIFRLTIKSGAINEFAILTDSLKRKIFIIDKRMFNDQIVISLVPIIEGTYESEAIEKLADAGVSITSEELWSE